MARQGSLGTFQRVRYMVASPPSPASGLPGLDTAELTCSRWHSRCNLTTNLEGTHQGGSSTPNHVFTLKLAYLDLGFLGALAVGSSKPYNLGLAGMTGMMA